MQVTALFFFFFSDTGVLTQGLMLAKQVLYSIEHYSLALFALVNLETGYHLGPVQPVPKSFYFMLPTIAGMASTH
jgi:hypothetical protein